jgi:hypothetical protein
LWIVIPARRQSCKQTLGEVQSRGRRRHRAFELREHGLIVAPVALIGCAPRGDVGRQRHGAALVDGWSSTGPWNANANVTSPPSPFASTVASSWPRKQMLPSLPKRSRSPGGQPLAGFTKARQCDPSRRRCSVASIIGFRRPASDTPAAQPGRYHLGVVDHDCVAGTQQIRQIAHAAICPFGRLARTYDQ